MEKFSLSDGYRLELHWTKAVYKREGVCELSGCTFRGPALAQAAQLNQEDFIMLDFFKQYLVVVSNVYVAKLSWSGVEYSKDGGIKLNNVTIAHDTELNKVPKLQDNDYLIIDTRGHDAEDHAFNLVYKTYVVNADTNLYNFGGK